MRPPRFLPLILLLAGVGSVRAQNAVLTVAWDASPDPGVTAYRVYYGLSSSSLSSIVEVPASQTSVLLTGLAPLTTYFTEVTALRAAGCESERSATASGTSSNPGPVCLSVAPAGAVLQGAIGQTITITGAGFEAEPTVRFFAPPLDRLPIVVRAQTPLGASTTRLTVTVDVGPTISLPYATPVGPISVEVKNADPTQPAAVCADAFSVALDPSRTDVNASGRIDGFDLSLYGIAFGAFDRVCAPDSPTGGSRGTRCDGEPDCGGSLSSAFCTDRACAPGSNANEGLACRAETDCGGTNGVTTFCAASPYNFAVDLDGDGFIDGDDLSVFGTQFGKTLAP